MSKTDELSQEWESILTEAHEKDPAVSGVVKRQGRGSKTLDGAPATSGPSKPSPGPSEPSGAPPSADWKVYTKEDVMPHVRGAMSLGTEVAGVTPYTDGQVDLTATCVAPVATKYQGLFIDQYPEYALLAVAALMFGIKYMEFKEGNSTPPDIAPPEYTDEM